MKGFFFLSGPGFSIGLFILFSLSLWLCCRVALFDRPQVCGNHLCAGSIPAFWCLPATLVELTDDHQVLAALEEVKFELSQFSNGHNVDPISTFMTCSVL
jgi:hypothetical protein